MQKTDFMIACQKEYTNRKLLITGISLQTKESGKQISYDTTHSAFIYPLSGSATISFNGQTFHTNPNDIIHGAKNQRVTFEVTSKEPFIHLNIYYDPEIPWHGSSDIMNMVYEISLLQDGGSLELLHRLKNSVMRANWDDQIQRNLIAQQLILSSFGYSYINQELLQIENAIELMETSYHKNLKLKDLAKAAHMDEAHFSYKFNKVYHIRPIDYLIRLRLRKAANLLLKGYSVTEAAWNVGYQDPLYFSRLYKKHFGIPPSHTYRNEERNIEYRRQSKEN